MEFNFYLLITAVLYFIVGVDFSGWAYYYIKTCQKYSKIGKDSGLKRIMVVFGLAISMLYIIITVFILSSNVIWTIVKFIILMMMGYIGSKSIKLIERSAMNTIIDNEDKEDYYN